MSTRPQPLPRMRARGTNAAVLTAAGVFIVLAFWWAPSGLIPGFALLPAIVVFALIVTLIMIFLPLHQDIKRFGPANGVTLARGVLTAWLAGLIGTEFSVDSVGWWVVGAALIAVSLDGIDGYLARWTGTASRFGARFDMEVDALFILIMSYLVYEADRAGVWILAMGLMRYGFLAGTWIFPSLRGALPDSLRRKAVCVLQGCALTLCFVPLVPDIAAYWIAAGALVSLTGSFVLDVHHLLTHASTKEV